MVPVSEVPAYDVVVIGGGIAGLTAAHALRDRSGVLLLEAAPVVGGKVRASEFGDNVLDEGAEQVLARQPDAIDLLQEVGLGDAVVYPRTSAASVWSRGRLRPLPTGTVLGVPADPMSVARSGVISVPGLLRAAADVLLPRTPMDTDVAVGNYVGARVGHEIVERLVDPLLGGVYAGRADALSLQATVPQLAAEVARHRTLTGAARAARTGTASSDEPVFAGVVDGLGRLPVAVAEAAIAQGVEVRTGTTVRALQRTDTGYRLTVGAVPVEQQIDARSVVVAVPATPASRLLQQVAPAAAAEIGSLEYASVAIVTLAYRGLSAPPRGSGFLVPAVERRFIKAVTLLSSKWAHLDGNLTLLRASVGRYGEQEDLQRDDADLIRRVHDDIAAILHIDKAPVISRVTRWGGGLPQYAPGHLDRVRRARAALPAGVFVCGAAYDGVGVPACVRSGRSAADGLRQWLGERANRSGQAQGT